MILYSQTGQSLGLQSNDASYRKNPSKLVNCQLERNEKVIGYKKVWLLGKHKHMKQSKTEECDGIATKVEIYACILQATVIAYN